MKKDQLKSSLTFTKSGTDRLSVFIIDLSGSVTFLLFSLVFLHVRSVGIPREIQTIEENRHWFTGRNNTFPAKSIYILNAGQKVR